MNKPIYIYAIIKMQSVIIVFCCLCFTVTGNWTTSNWTTSNWTTSNWTTSNWTTSNWTTNNWTTNNWTTNNHKICPGSFSEPICSDSGPCNATLCQCYIQKCDRWCDEYIHWTTSYYKCVNCLGSMWNNCCMCFD